MIPLASVVINILIVVLTIAAWLWMMLGLGESSKLAHEGLGSLKYYTVLSNLLSAAVSVAYLVACVMGVAQLPSWLLTLKLAAASDVMLTFVTVVVLLAPRYGWASMYREANFWLHLVLPLLAAIDCCLYVPVRNVTIPMTLMAVVPTVLYGIVYIINVIVHDAEPGDPTYDFYGFFQWGKEKILLVLAVMLGANWGLALILRLINMLIGLS